MTEKIVILSTCASEAEAARVAQTLVESGAAACVNVIPRVRSYYRWQGRLQSGDEFLLVIKSSRDRFAQVRAAVERVHSYEVPELIALPIVEGAPAYLAWLEENLNP